MSDAALLVSMLFTGLVVGLLVALIKEGLDL